MNGKQVLWCFCLLTLFLGINLRRMYFLMILFVYCGTQCNNHRNDQCICMYVLCCNDERSLQVLIQHWIVVVAILLHPLLSHCEYDSLMRSISTSVMKKQLKVWKQHHSRGGGDEKSLTNLLRLRSSMMVSVTECILFVVHTLYCMLHQYIHEYCTTCH